ncbi:MAG: ABC transporter substrate-binding protein [Ignavibacteria bacterium]|jgi:NitT/TauT family transport system substrate-binding protein|nr:ABC transporter substrate-binding protein [Ignavibacteria bacterium]
MKRILLLAVFTLLCLTACKQDNTANAPVILKVGVMSSMDYVPLAVAQKLNLFKKYNVIVEIQKFYSANDRDAAFQSGAIDGTVIDYTGAILQKNGGMDLKITSACNSTFALMTAGNSGITKLSDLKGKKISVSRNTVIDFCIDMALQSVTLTADDVKKQEINKIPIRFEMLLKGETDATALPDPFMTIATSKDAKTLVKMDELGYAVTGIMFRTNAINEKTKEIDAFYKAYNEAVDYISSHKIDDIKDILVAEIGFPKPLISSVILPTYTHAELPNTKDIQKVVQWLQAKKLIENVDMKDIFDERFVKNK